MKPRMIAFLAALLLAFATGAMAQSSTEPGSSAGPGGTLNDDAAMRQDSSAIQKQIKRNLQKQNLNDVDVQVSNDQILLTGNVPTRADRINALEIARSLGQQHRKIVDNMTVTNDNGAPSTQPDNNTPPQNQSYPR